MSKQERHEAPAKTITERHTFKLELRKRTVRSSSGIKDTLTQESKATTSLSSKENQTKEKSHAGGVGPLAT